MMPTLLHRRRSTYVVAVGLLLVAAVVLLRGVVTTTVVVRPGGGPEEDHAAGSLPAVQQDLMASFTAGNNPCLVPAPSTPFQGKVGHNGHHGIIDDCQREPIAACYQRGDDPVYCWSDPYYYHAGAPEHFCLCFPLGDQWKAISAEYVNPVTDPLSCGSPCTDIRPQYNFLRDDDSYSY